MPAPKNKLKAALARRELQIGIWLACAIRRWRRWPGQPAMIGV